MTAENSPEEVGLCTHCQHLRRVRSERGSTFYMCRRSATDSSFPKYPPLPVLTCPGYEPADSTSSAESAPPSP